MLPSLVTGSHVVVPEGGFANDGKPFEVSLKDGRKLETEYAVVATGQTPNTDFLSGLEPSETGSLINPINGFIRVRPNLQFLDPKYPHLFAVGDIADSGAHKAARPGRVQATAAAKNIAAMIAGKELAEEIAIAPPAIHLTLGLVSPWPFSACHSRGEANARIRRGMSSFATQIPRRGEMSL